MINVQGNRWIPSNGFKYITNGKVWSDSILLGRTDNIEHWHDTNDEPREPIEEPTEEELNRSAQYLFDQDMIELPAQSEPDYLNEREPEPNYFA